MWSSFWAWLMYDVESKREVVMKLDHFGNLIFILTFSCEKEAIVNAYTFKNN